MAMNLIGPPAMATAVTSAETVVAETRVLTLRKEFSDVFIKPGGLPPVWELVRHINFVD